MEFRGPRLAAYQRLVDNPAVGGRLINASWYLKKLRLEHGSLMLSDRPLIRTTHGADHPGATWVLALGPSIAFIAANHPANARRIKKASPATFIYRVNQSAAAQAERYVLTVDARHETKLARYLKEKRP
jgi:hypothetical protein